MTAQNPEPKNQTLQPESARISPLLQVLIRIKAPAISIVIAVLSAVFFGAIGFKNISFISAVGQRSIGLLVLSGIFLLTFLACYYSGWSTFKKYSVWLQSNLLTFFSFAYFIGINAVNISVFNITLNTGFAGGLFSILILLVNLNLFGKNQRKMYLVVPQIILFGLQTFSFINLIEKDKTALRAFTTDWIELIFNVNNNLWLVLCAVSISIVSILSFQLKSLNKNLLFAGIFAVLNLEALFAIDNVAGLSYWYKALLFLVFWDFIYNPFFTISNDIKDPSFRAKLIISTVYHLILIFVIIAGKPIFG
jgi:hypothetical protein